MKEHIQTIREDLKIIGELHARFPLKKNEDSCGPLLYTCIAPSELVEDLKIFVRQYFGPPYKEAGEGVFFKNLFDKFARAVGGMGKDQTYFRKEISSDLVLCCAFWPWSGNSGKTSVRFELLVGKPVESEALAAALTGSFPGS
ncbi:MAG: hypothetical protein KKB30_03710 [Proteobacteria bacterium]|nr:hypothetical protein [Pseudomonadota bacterium]MBU1715623.1 hypothetical protein [Pseudomonadota bacterium]